MKKKILLSAIVALSVALLVAVGGTVAWLFVSTDSITNTFDPSDIGVKLEETTSAYKLIPGWTIDKNPKASVEAGSVDSYLFVQVTKSDNFDAYVDYLIDSAWTPLEGSDGVYYIEIDTDAEKGQAFSVLGNGSKEYNGVSYFWAQDQVLTKPTVTKGMMGQIATNKPNITFKAYAVQLWKNNTTKFTPAEAWTIATGANS